MDRNIPMFGYLTCYLKYTSHDSIYYAKFSTDFCKPLTEEFFSMLLNHVKQIYEQQYGQILTGCFCTKEEYDAHNDNREETSVTWETDDNGETKTQIKNLEMLKHTDDWIYELGIYVAAIGDIVLNTFNNERDAIDLYVKIPKAEEQKLFLIRRRYRNGKREQEQYQNGDTWHWHPIQSELKKGQIRMKTFTQVFDVTSHWITTHPDKFIAGILNVTDISIEQLSITNEQARKQHLNLYSDEQISEYLKSDIPYPTCLEMEGVWRTSGKPIPIVLFLSFNDDGMFTDITIQVATGMGHVPSQLWQKLQTEIQIEIYGLYHPETMQLISTAETEEELRNEAKLANTVRRMVGKAPLQMGLVKVSLDELNGKETPIFTDTEYRLLLSALTKEELVCAEVDKSGSGKPLLPSIVSIQHKLHLIQYGHK